MDKTGGATARDGSKSAVWKTNRNDQVYVPVSCPGAAVASSGGAGTTGDEPWPSITKRPLFSSATEIGRPRRAAELTTKGTLSHSSRVGDELSTGTKAWPSAAPAGTSALKTMTLGIETGRSVREGQGSGGWLGQVLWPLRAGRSTVTLAEALKDPVRGDQDAAFAFTWGRLTVLSASVVALMQPPPVSWLEVMLHRPVASTRLYAMEVVLPHRRKAPRNR